MQVYGPTPSKLQVLRQDNPTYWQLLLSRSEYSESQINQELANIDFINARLHSLLAAAYDLLIDENYIKGFSSDAHQKLSAMLAEISYVHPSFSQNSHMNCFPVSKWQREVTSLGRQIGKIEKFIRESIK